MQPCWAWENFFQIIKRNLTDLWCINGRVVWQNCKHCVITSFGWQKSSKPHFVSCTVFIHDLFQWGKLQQLHPDPRGWGVFTWPWSGHRSSRVEERGWCVDVLLWCWHLLHTGISQHLSPQYSSRSVISTRKFIDPLLDKTSVFLPFCTVVWLYYRV